MARRIRIPDPGRELGVRLSAKPLLIGGGAMEYYGLRKRRKDWDFVVPAKDYRALARRYPESRVDLFGDLGMRRNGFEIWRTICLFGYSFLSRGARSAGRVKVVSLEKLLFLKAIASHKKKYMADMRLVVGRIFSEKYRGKRDIGENP